MNIKSYDRITERIVSLIGARHRPLAQAVAGHNRIAPQSRHAKSRIAASIRSCSCPWAMNHRTGSRSVRPSSLAAA